MHWRTVSRSFALLAPMLVACAASVVPADVGNAVADDASHADTGFDRPPVCGHCQPCDCTCADRIGRSPQTAHIAIVPVFDTNNVATSDSVRVTLTTPYWLGRFEITNRCYQACRDAGDCAAPDTSNFDMQIGANYSTSSSKRDYPAAGLTWQQARDVCRFYGGDLPSFAQWLYAARGDDARPFPWGNDLACDRGHYGYIWRDGSGPMLMCLPALTDFDLHQVPTTVGSFPAGAGPFGTLDLLGNVSEWLLDAATEHLAYSRALVAMPGEAVDPVVMNDTAQRLTGGLHGSDGVSQSWATESAGMADPLRPYDGARCIWRTNPNTP